MKINNIDILLILSKNALTSYSSQHKKLSVNRYWFSNRFGFVKNSGFCSSCFKQFWWYCDCSCLFLCPNVKYFPQSQRCFSKAICFTFSYLFLASSFLFSGCNSLYIFLLKANIFILISVAFLSCSTCYYFVNAISVFLCVYPPVFLILLDYCKDSF